MTMKTGERQKRIYSIHMNKQISKKFKLLVVFCIIMGMFLSACEKQHHDDTSSTTAISEESIDEAQEVDTDNELAWEWAVEAGVYEYIFFVDDELIAAKKENRRYSIFNMKGEKTNESEYSYVAGFYG